MKDSAETVVGNATWLILQRSTLLLSSLILALTLPRMMGPVLYGQLALLQSISGWFQSISLLGFEQVAARFIPELIARKDQEEAESFFGTLLSVRMVVASLAAVAFFAITFFWLYDIEIPILILFGLVIVLGASSRLVYFLFLGLRQVVRWAFYGVLQGWLHLMFILPGYLLGGFIGACVALVLTQGTILALGGYWAHAHLRFSGIHRGLKRMPAYFKFGLSFYISALIQGTLGASGEAVLRIVTQDYKQVAYYHLAFRIYQLGLGTLTQLTLSLIPFFTVLAVENRSRDEVVWNEAILKWFSIPVFMGILATLFLADDFIPLIFGADYATVAKVFLPLALGLLAVTLADVCSIIAASHNRPDLNLKAALCRLLTFWSLAVPLTVSSGAVGTAVAALGSSIGYAAAYRWGIGSLARVPAKAALRALGVGCLFVPVSWFRADSLLVNVWLYVACSCAYVGLLLLFRVVTWSEVEKILSTLRRKHRGNEQRSKVKDRNSIADL